MEDTCMWKQENKNYINTQQDNEEEWRKLHIMQKEINQQRISISKEVNNSISHKPNLLISIAFVAIAFIVVPILPIVLGIVFGHWISKQSDKNKRG